MRVLVASAEATLRDRLCEMIFGNAPDVERCDVHDFSEASRALDSSPDVVVCDAMLPGHERHGYQLMSEAIVLGIPVVVICPGEKPLLHEKLESLGVPWASRKGPWSRAMVEAIDAALRRSVH